MTIRDILNIVGIGFTLAFAGVIFYFIRIAKKEKDTREETIEEAFNDNGEIVEMRAEVIDMACGTKSIGIQIPELVEWYVIVFRNDMGKVIEVPANLEMYEGIEIGMHGILKLVDGALYSFEAK